MGSNHSELERDAIYIEGYLEKERGFQKTPRSILGSRWKRRYFVLTGESLYYCNESKEGKTTTKNIAYFNNQFEIIRATCDNLDIECDDVETGMRT